MAGARSAPLVVIFNRRALAARALRRAGLEEALRERRLRYQVVDADSSQATRSAAQEAAAAGEVVVAAGGDGTSLDVLNGVLAAGRRDVVMGHIPLGTGNDLARALGRIGRGFERALDALAEFRTESIDVAQVNGGEYFLNVLGIGFDAEVVRRRLKQRFKIPGYFPTVVRTILHYRPQRYRVTWPGGALEGESLLTAAMNGNCEGGGFRLAPNARLEDGLLDIYWIDPISITEFARYVWAVRRGTHERLPMVHKWRTARMTVESEGRIQYHLDGEYRELSAGEPLELVVHHRRLQMIV
ncbi:MAG: YegS/Rv2252/BmrU family lipid kinase [Gemmatimonadota bacterium]|nr:MAG: YegS/Rv2252/BmrU family lipid kinase [Gemmatimonadota bacterium]